MTKRLRLKQPPPHTMVPFDEVPPIVPFTNESFDKWGFDNLLQLIKIGNYLVKLERLEQLAREAVAKKDAEQKAKKSGRCKSGGAA